MNFMPWFVKNTSKGLQVEDKIPIRPFKFDAATENAPSHFQICFFHNELRYRYGFEVDKEAVKKEWLFRAEKEKEKESPLFLREGDGIEVTDDYAEGRGLEKNTRDNALFLSVVAQLNGKEAGSILRWFWGFRVLLGLNDMRYERYTASLLQDKNNRDLLLEFIRRADVGIENLIATEVAPKEGNQKKSPEGIPQELQQQKEIQIKTIHPKFRQGVRDGVATIDFSEESEGTKKLFRIAGPFLDCLKNGYIVGVDELDAKLHPLLTKAAVRLFNSTKSNPKNAQLIFASHDTNLLQSANMRRDQIWFVEKTEAGATDLYSLAEIKLAEGTKVRNDAAFEKNYIRGRYGAIPFLGDLETLLKETADGAPR
jgi:AAA15 family ATPase/GTPase